MEKDLVVLNYMFKPLAVLNDQSDDRARSIQVDTVTNGVSKLTFEIPLKSRKWHLVATDNLILYDGQLYIIQIPNINQNETMESMTIECHHQGVSLEGKTNQAFERADAVGKTIRQMADLVLEGTGWEFGTSDIPDDKMRSLVVKEQSAMANIKKIAELFDCDYYFDATLDRRLVHFREGSKDRLLTVSEGVNLKTLNVNIDKSQLITRLYVFGGNDDVTNRPILLAGAKMVDRDGEPVLDENGVQKIYDKTYLEDYSYYTDQGYTLEYINAHPELFLRESVLTLSDYIDRDELYADSFKTLAVSAQPKIEITFDMADKIEEESYFMDTPELTEVVYVYSDKINEKIIIKNDKGYNGNLFQLKVSGIKTDSEKPESVQITAKNYSEYGGIVQNLISNIDDINSLVQSDGSINTGKLQGWIDVLATQIKSTQSFWYTDKDGNMIFENKNGTDAMKLGGGVLALANSLNPDGSFQWRAFGTGQGFTATELVAGWLIGGKVKFDLEGGRLLIGDDWIDNYHLKFEPATGLKMKYKSSFMEFSDDGFILRDKDYETLITPQGMADTNTDTVTDNVDTNYPLVIPVKIDDSVSVVHQVLLNYTNLPFRTYSTGADTRTIGVLSTAYGGGDVQSSSIESINLTSTNMESFTSVSTTSGGGITPTSSTKEAVATTTQTDGSVGSTTPSGGSASSSTPSGGGRTSLGSSISTTNQVYGFSGSVETAVAHTAGASHAHYLARAPFNHDHGMSHTHGTGNHSHNFTTPAHSHDFTVPNHQHKLTIPAHSHTVTIPAHTHDFTTPRHSHTITMPSHSHSVTIPSHAHSVTIPSHSHGVVFGILESRVQNMTIYVYINGVQRTSTTSSYGVVDLTQWIQTAGWHTIELRANSMKKISASVSVKSYMTR